MDRYLKIIGALICLLTLAVVAVILVLTPTVPGWIAMFFTILPAVALAIMSGLAITVAGAILTEMKQIRHEAEQQTLAIQDMAKTLRNAKGL